MVHTAGLQNLQLIAVRFLEWVLLALSLGRSDFGVGLNIWSRVFDTCEGSCHDSLDLLVVAGFGLALVLLLRIQLADHPELAWWHWRLVGLGVSTRILSTHSEGSRSSFLWGHVGCDLTQHLVDGLLLGHSCVGRLAARVTLNLGVATQVYDLLRIQFGIA